MGAQADTLAQTVVDANNNTMQQFDRVEGRMDKLQTTENKDLQTAEEALQKAGASFRTSRVRVRSTIFFKTGSTEIDQFQYQRLVNFLDYLGRESRGRTVILLSIGSASAIGRPQFNKKLSRGAFRGAPCPSSSRVPGEHPSQVL